MPDTTTNPPKSDGELEAERLNAMSPEEREADRVRRVEAAKERLRKAAPIAMSPGRDAHGVIVGFFCKSMPDGQVVPALVLRCCAPIDPANAASDMCGARIEIPLPGDLPLDQVQLRAHQDDQAEYLEFSGRCEDCTQRVGEEIFVTVDMLAGFENVILNSGPMFTVYEGGGDGDAA
jgi:hypothetical protein